MTGIQLTESRKQKAWNQRKAASRLGVSQPYLSLLERGERPITEELARKAARIFRLSPVALPLRAGRYTAELVTEDELASDLAMLGYLPFSHLSHPRLGNRRPGKNPAEVLASALRFGNLDSRLTEALPWVALRFPELDWPWLVSTAKLNDLQNRLGFVISLARKLAERRGEMDKAAVLARQESILERSRLAREDTLSHDSLTRAERDWLRKHRSDTARHWGLLTDLSAEHLSYGD